MSLEQWEHFYRNGAIATFPTTPDGLLDREVRHAWAEFFSTLPNDARVLDVGTGNGIVALIAAETAASRQQQWDIQATDLARIDPLRHVQDGVRRLAGITFHAEVANEHLPFESESFDAVSGNYAIEYGDIGATLREIHRVLKPGGDAQFVLHDTASVLFHGAKWALREADLVLRETKAFRRLHRLVTMDRVTPGATQLATDELRAAIHTLKQALQQARHAGAGRVLGVALDSIQKLLSARKQMRPAAAGLEVDRAEFELRVSVRRLNDLVAYAKSEQDMESIRQESELAGFSLVEHSPLFHGGTSRVGWQLLMHRA